MGIFSMQRQAPDRGRLYRELANPSTPFLRTTVLMLLRELTENYQTIDAAVTHVPHNRFDRLTWDFYYRPNRRYIYVGRIMYYKDNKTVYQVDLKISDVEEEWYDTTDKRYYYPFWVVATPSTERGKEIILESVYGWEFDIDKYDNSVILSDLLAGFADVALNILGRLPLKIDVIETVERELGGDVQ